MEMYDWDGMAQCYVTVGQTRCRRYFFYFCQSSEIQSSHVQTEMLARKNQCHLQFTGKNLADKNEFNTEQYKENTASLAKRAGSSSSPSKAVFLCRRYFSFIISINLFRGTI